MILNVPKMITAIATRTMAMIRIGLPLRAGAVFGVELGVTVGTGVAEGWASGGVELEVSAGIIVTKERRCL